MEPLLDEPELELGELDELDELELGDPPAGAAPEPCPF